MNLVLVSVAAFLLNACEGRWIRQKRQFSLLNLPFVRVSERNFHFRHNTKQDFGFLNNFMDGLHGFFGEGGQTDVGSDSLINVDFDSSGEIRRTQLASSQNVFGWAGSSGGYSSETRGGVSTIRSHEGQGLAGTRDEATSLVRIDRNHGTASLKQSRSLLNGAAKIGVDSLLAWPLEESEDPEESSQGRLTLSAKGSVFEDNVGGSFGIDGGLDEERNPIGNLDARFSFLQGLLAGGSRVRSKIDMNENTFDWSLTDGLDGFVERYHDILIRLPKATTQWPRTHI